MEVEKTVNVSTDDQTNDSKSDISDDRQQVLQNKQIEDTMQEEQKQDQQQQENQQQQEQITHQQQANEDSRWKIFNQIFNKQNFSQFILNHRISDKYFSGFQIHLKDDRDLQEMKSIFQKGSRQWITYQQQNPKEAKAIAAFLGNTIGDALGAHTEFEHFKFQKSVIKGHTWKALKEYVQRKYGQRTEFGVITDDCSMARCMADSFLCNNMDFNPTDMRMRFLLWWNTGYCNGSQDLRSFGLGGNISQGFSNFVPQNCPPYVVADPVKDRGDISGNGGIMRLSPIPIRFHDDLKKGEEIAVLQSLTTHNGGEAAELCKLLTHIVIKLINYEGDNPKSVLETVGQDFQTDCEAVAYMAKSQAEPKGNYKKYNKSFNKCDEDRYWNWQDPQLKVSPTRVRQQPGYFGSYAMDGCYVALNIVYNSNSFEEAVFKAVNWGGDADSMAAVVGYVSGPMYGITAPMLDLYFQEIEKHDKHSVFVKAVKLFRKHPITTLAHYQEQQ